MAKGSRKKPAPEPEESPEQGGEDKGPDAPANLKCYKSEAVLIGRVAGALGFKSVADFLRSPAMRRYLLHQLIAAGQQAEADLKVLDQDPT